MEDAKDEATTEVKVEDSATNEDNATTTVTTSLAKETAVWPTKADREIMDGIVKRLSDYVPPGYVNINDLFV